MHSSKELTDMFFSDLKSFNTTNFKYLSTSDIRNIDEMPEVHKAFSSVITRYFIFREKHPEVSEMESKMLYYKLKLDLIAKYFADYPEATPDDLVAFQIELNSFVEERKRQTEENLNGGQTA